MKKINLKLRDFNKDEVLTRAQLKEILGGGQMMKVVALVVVTPISVSALMEAM